MGYEITTLVENSVATSFGLLAEHGQSLLIEGQDRCILFDTGQGNALLNNAEKLGKDLSRVDTVVLSHGHFDHTGGLRALTQVNKNFELICHPDAFAPKLALMPGPDGPQHKPIGMNMSHEDLEDVGERVRLLTDPTEIAPGIMTTGETPMNNDFEKIEPVLMVRDNGGQSPDKLADDLSLIIKSEKGLVILLGCAHRGVINILDHARAVTGEDKVYAVLGGMHLERAPIKQIVATIGMFKKLDVKKIGPSHCTGSRAMAAMYQTMEPRIIPCFVGAKFVC